MGDRFLPNLPKTNDGFHLLASNQKTHNGSARFIMPLPQEYAKDPGLALLARCETFYGGYEYPYRKFLNRHLESGDLFVDVGAHFGIYSLTAASAPCENINVLSIEPDPNNMRMLKFWVKINNRDKQIETIEAACGADVGQTKLWPFSTMGHQVGMLRPKEALIPSGISVKMVSIDKLLVDRKSLSDKRVFIKIDVEGGEPAVLDGASDTLKAGRIAAIIFEKSEAYGNRDSRVEFDRVSEHLLKLGFHLYWFPHVHMAGVIMPWVSGDETGNIIAVSRKLLPNIKANPIYDGCFASYPPPPPSISEARNTSYGYQARVNFTKKIIRARATDGWRWCRPPNLKKGAEMRALMVLPHLPRVGSLIDIGAGTMELFRKLPIAVKYTPLDIVRFSNDTIIADLNQNQFPAGYWDMGTLLGVLEYIHDGLGLLKNLRSALGKLYIIYDIVSCDTVTNIEERRSCGYVNDYSVTNLSALLKEANWDITSIKNSNDQVLVSAQ